MDPLNLNRQKAQLASVVKSGGLKKTIIIGIISVLLFIALAFIVTNLFVNVNADQICCVQDPFDGDLHFYFTAGLKQQNFGKVTFYKKRSIYTFQNQVRFNDGGHAIMHGSVQYELPLFESGMKKIQEQYGSQSSVELQLLKTVVDKCVYMVGPLMSSKESYAEKKNYLISYVEDQIANGVYMTTSKEVKTTDQMTNAEKTITVVEIVKGPDGQPLRQEVAPLKEFNIPTKNFSINNMPYDSAIEKQIKQQQELFMDVQTSIADAKKAEQRAITVAKNGEANAAEAKWAQEVIKAKMVTEAQQRYEVSVLDKKAAEQNKLTNILDGQGEAEKRRLIMAADGALEMKIDAWVKSQQYWAAAFGTYTGNIVPMWMSGGTQSKGGSNGVNDFISLMTLQAANQLGLNMNIKGGK